MSFDAPMPRRVTILAILIALGCTLFLGFTAGGFQLKGNQGASLDRCTFKRTDNPYEYPHQPLASDDPPYSTLFQNVCIDGGTERSIPDLKSVTNASETYVCACCGQPLFGGEAKFDSRTGWPSFWAPYKAEAIGYARDLLSVELHCKTCGAHLGHVFNWPKAADNPTGLRYCIDGVCLRKVVSAALAAGGGAYVDSLPVILPDIVIMMIILPFLASYGMSVFGMGEALLRYVNARKEQRQTSTEKARSSRAIA